MKNIAKQANQIKRRNRKDTTLKVKRNKNETTKFTKNTSISGWTY